VHVVNLSWLYVVKIHSVAVYVCAYLQQYQICLIASFIVPCLDNTDLLSFISCFVVTVSTGASPAVSHCLYFVVEIYCSEGCNIVTSTCC